MSAPTRTSPAVRSLQAAMHGLFVLLLVIGTVRGVQHTSHPVYLAIGCLLLAGWYAVGLALARRSTPAVGRWWFAGLAAGWAVLVAAESSLAWVAFALFFLALHLVPRPWSLLAVVALTGVSVAALLHDSHAALVPSVLGPVIGAAVAVGISWIYRELRVESEQRAALNTELLAAQQDLLTTSDALAIAQRQAGALAERSRLARDIHDTLAQSFSSIVLLSRAGLAEPAAGTDPQLLRQIEQTAAGGLADARTVVQALTPPELTEAPLSAALERLVERHRAQGLDATLVIEGADAALPTAIEVAVLRLAQGALANVRQHAQARRAVVTVTHDPDQVSLDVRDDGVGFDPSAPRTASQAGGFGLRAMHERAADAGGTLEVESAPGEGTTVHAHFPLGAGMP